MSQKKTAKIMGSDPARQIMLQEHCERKQSSDAADLVFNTLIDLDIEEIAVGGVWVNGRRMDMQAGACLHRMMEVVAVHLEFGGG